MLYDLLDERRIEKEGVDLASYRDIYTSLADYPDGEEIAHSYETIMTFLSYKDLPDLLVAEQVSSQLALSIFFHDAIRPTVLTTLTHLGKVGTDIAVYHDAPNRQTQLAALARATGDLNDLSEYVSEEVMAPEQYLLRRIISQWQQLIIEAIGELGKSEIN